MVLLRRLIQILKNSVFAIFFMVKKKKSSGGWLLLALIGAGVLWLLSRPKAVLVSLSSVPNSGDSGNTLNTISGNIPNTANPVNVLLPVPDVTSLEVALSGNPVSAAGTIATLLSGSGGTQSSVKGTAGYLPDAAYMYHDYKSV